MGACAECIAIETLCPFWEGRPNGDHAASRITLVAPSEVRIVSVTSAAPGTSPGTSPVTRRPFDHSTPSEASTTPNAHSIAGVSIGM